MWVAIFVMCFVCLGFLRHSLYLDICASALQLFDDNPFWVYFYGMILEPRRF